MLDLLSTILITMFPEIQVSPEPSIRRLSTAVLPQEQYEDAKASMVTDTTAPCRRFDTTLVTSKGTILSCAGISIIVGFWWLLARRRDLLDYKYKMLRLRLYDVGVLFQGEEKSVTLKFLSRAR